MKSGFRQIQINEQDRYKTSFKKVSFGHYEWNACSAFWSQKCSFRISKDYE